MNRRKALFATMLLGGLLPRRLLAQTPGSTARSRKASTDTATTARPARRASAGDDPAEQPVDDSAAAADSPPPADFPSESGQQWRTFDISKYTSLEHNQNNPQTAIIEWIFRRTESAPWHADKVAVLCASRAQVRAYHTPTILRQVAEMVERFTDSTADVLSVRVRFVAAADTRWRYAVNTRLNLLGSGPQGQQIWTLKLEDAASVLTQMQVYQGFKLVADRRFEMINGQTIFMQSSVSRNYVAGLQRDSAAGQGFQPAVKPLEEGVVLRLSPLLSFEGDTLDAAIEFRANTIRALHRTTVLAPREVGPSETTIDVPEVSETRLNQTVRGWPLGQTLLISAGIHPGILQSKTGFMNLRIPGTVPTSTELLAFVDVETTTAAPKAARNHKPN
jgi:hypothetical protein